MLLKSLPTQERPREKLLAQGAASLSDAELLAIFLRTGTPGRSVLTLARDLIQTYGGLRALLAASQIDFCRFPGMGTAKYAQLHAAIEMSRRVLDEPLRAGDPLESPDITRRYLQTRLSMQPQEVFAVLFLDNRHRLIRYEELFNGTIDSATVYPREVVRKALTYNAAALILAHNHPSGDAEPSSADIQLTRRLVSALGLVDIRILDHMVVGHGQVVSFAEKGLL